MEFGASLRLRAAPSAERKDLFLALYGTTEVVPDTCLVSRESRVRERAPTLCSERRKKRSRFGAKDGAPGICVNSGQRAGPDRQSARRLVKDQRSDALSNIGEGSISPGRPAPTKEMPDRGR